MNRLQTARRRRLIRRLPLAAVALSVVWSALAAHVTSTGWAHAAVAAQEQCGVALDGTPVGDASRPEDAVDIDADATVELAALAPGDADRVRVSVVEPLVSWTLVDEPIPPGGTFRDSIDVAEVSRLGVLGLHRVDIESGSCAATVWVRITGRSPLTTPLGIAGAVTVVGGAILLVSALLRSRSGVGRSILRGAIGGALCGLGALVLAQQFGWVAATDEVLGAWVGFPGLGGAGLSAAARLGAPDRRDAAPVPGPAEPPPPSASPSPPPSASPSPPPSASPPPPPSASPSPPPAASPSARPSASPSPPPAASPPAPPPAPSPPAPPTMAEPPPTMAEAPVAADVPVTMDTDGDGAADTGPVPIGDDLADPPREAHPRIEAPDAVVAGQAFDLVVGLSATPVPGTLGGPIVRPPTSVGPYVLAVQVVADEFVLADHADGGWRRELPVTVTAPYPSTTFRLAALGRDTDVWSAAIQVLFSVDGQTMGTAFRTVAVVAREGLLARAAPLTHAPTTVIPLAAQPDPADLTVRILRGRSPTDGRLLWTFETTHGLDLPDEAVMTDVGANPAEYTRRVIVLAAQHRNRPTLEPWLRGLARDIAAQVPDELFELLRAVAARVRDRPPRVLLLSAEPYIWWELAEVDPPLDPASPAHLAAQADVGRWVLADGGPPLPPPLGVDADDIVVVTGEYPAAEWRLPEATAEARDILSEWRAVAVDAAGASVVECIGGVPPGGVLHFALHGSYAPEGILEGLVLVDGDLLDPEVVRGCSLPEPALVFLNACQVGNGNVVLGDYAGLAEAFLAAGAAAVVAPLWSIDDAAARQLALRFYRRVLDGGEPPAAVLRDERRSFAAPGGDGAATRLAYQFFGHPALTLRRGP